MNCPNCGSNLVVKGKFCLIAGRQFRKIFQSKLILGRKSWIMLVSLRRRKTEKLRLQRKKQNEDTDV